MILPNYIRELKSNGIGLDVDGYSNVALKYLEEKRNNYLRELSALVGVELTFDNCLQIVRAFLNRGIRLERMNQEYLKEHQDDCREIFLLYKAKEYEQKLHAYSLDKLVEHMGSDGRIRADWYIANNTTGRLICRAPALQGMPSYCRQFFKPDNGCCFVTIDFSTIEMRVLARISGDERLIRELQEGCDIHRQTASVVFGKSLEEVNNEERQVGKAVGFMVVYGGSAVGLSKKLSNLGVECSVEDAQIMISSFYQKHLDVAYYHHDLRKGIIKPTTINGQVFEGLTGSKALNYPVQASAAEGFKLTLTEIVKRKPEQYKLVMAIHDSITLEVPAEEKVTAESFLKSTAEEVMGSFLSPVPVFAEIKLSI